MDGSFNITNNALAMISGPQITEDVLRKFGLLAERALEKQITTDELQKQAAEIAPALGGMIGTIKTSPYPIGFVLLLMVTFLKSCNFNTEAKLDLNQLFDQLTGHLPVVLSRVDGQDTKNAGGGMIANPVHDSAKAKVPGETKK